MDILPTVVSVAADEPDTAANTVHPTTFVCSKPPGMRANQGASPLNMSSDKRVRKRISPIQMNSGNAVNVQLLAPVHTVMIMALPGSRVVNPIIPM